MAITDGSRRAYVSFVDHDSLAGFLVLLKSLILNNPGSTADLVVLHDGLPGDDAALIRTLRPGVRFVRVDPALYERFRRPGGSSGAPGTMYAILDAFRLRDYDRVITLGTDMTVLGEIEGLFDLPEPFAAVPRSSRDDDPAFDGGLLVFGREHMSDEFVARLERVGSDGAYAPDEHGQGLLNAVLGSGYHRLDRTYNWTKEASQPGRSQPGDVRVLHFTGRYKPWTGGEHGYAELEATWRSYDLTHLAFFARYLALSDGGAPTDPVLESHYRDVVRDVPAELLDRLVARDVDKVGRLVAEATALSQQGRYAAAVAVRQAVAGQTGRISDPLRLAGDLRALSRYDEAAAIGLLAVKEPEPWLAEQFLSETAWVTGDLAAAREHLDAALHLNPVHAKARALDGRLRAGSVDAGVQATTTPGGLRLTHAAFYMDELGNYGDELLPVAVRESVAAVRPVESWNGVHVHQVFDAAAVERANATDAVLVGGGGLFLPDTMPNGNSGWQWNVPDDSLRSLRVPLGLVAVGYNLFEGQEIHGSRFGESLRLTVERATLVGLRNHGSIDRVRDLLPAELQDRVRYMPCPTTFLGLLPHGPGARVERAVEPGRRPVVHLNIAFDRTALRFKGRYDGFLAELDRFVRAAGELADIRIAAHTVGDERVAQDLYATHGTRVPVDCLFRLGVDGALQLYADSDLVIGMRGHAGMIPFGVGTPIVSLVSHPKLRYFLEDVGHPEWGLPIFEEHLGDRLLELTRAVLDDPGQYRKAVAGARESLREQYDESLAVLLRAV
ncbi:polysaccharide pyruvyl transferase family protein [Promicromonospora thailandica]|uniref:Lipopolysaccharide biosynthesis protein, LPS:glycosyltransferase n=1 Tax=Promicromonospora thailandica TaxID=765201 RepID=A0A9X2G5T2_9MICO|nr:polysaccharide pyruvyl transferase family protein [Promicromonospora thailandica]MCP2266098.1 Lipopolysaccharide biosynthesis protein, LPS:glycosyltransferase [Promicromonospora thailandica]BFF20565.1 hypothetical protein GCM10025730_40860 [Promicromonospora thailandica]